MRWVAPQWEWRISLAVWGMQLRNMWGNANFHLPPWLLCRGLQPGHDLGKRQSLGGRKDTSLEVLNPFWSCPVSWEHSLTFFPVSYFQMMSLILFLRLRMGLSCMKFLRRQLETESFDPEVTSFSSSQHVSVCVPWAAVSTGEYLHPSTCEKAQISSDIFWCRWKEGSFLFSTLALPVRRMSLYIGSVSSQKE